MLTRSISAYIKNPLLEAYFQAQSLLVVDLLLNLEMVLPTSTASNVLTAGAPKSLIVRSGV